MKCPQVRQGGLRHRALAGLARCAREGEVIRHEAIQTKSGRLAHRQAAVLSCFSPSTTSSPEQSWQTGALLRALAPPLNGGRSGGVSNKRAKRIGIGSASMSAKMPRNFLGSDAASNSFVVSSRFTAFLTIACTGDVVVGERALRYAHKRDTNAHKAKSPHHPLPSAKSGEGGALGPI